MFLTNEKQECFGCSEGDPINECPSSQRSCGHHCNHIWTHDNCHWCGLEESEAPLVVPARSNNPKVSERRKSNLTINTYREKTMKVDPTPYSLWKKADQEYPNDTLGRILRYQELMIETGYYIVNEEKDDNNKQ